MNSVFGLVEPVWAITAGVCGTTVTSTGTVARMKRRFIGTLVGVPIGLARLPVADCLAKRENRKTLLRDKDAVR
ncbi:hypothetical protein G3O01_15485 [Burkholderia sp. Ac-20365]|nr:hypothetical protein [Burkholderia sp. Ac-20365]